MTFELIMALLGLLEKAPEIAESVDRILSALKQKTELTDEQWAAVKARRQALMQSDAWQP